MAAPTFFAAGTASNDTGGGTSVTPSYPASIAADDVAIIIHALYDSGAGGSMTLSTPSGWTAFGAQVNDGSNFMIARAYWKRLAGSESGTVSVTHSSGSAQVYARMGVYRGCTTVGDPFEDYDTSGGSASSFTSPSTTTTGSDRLGVRISAVNSGLAESPPSGWTENYETADTSLTVAGDSKTIASASTEAASARTEGFSTYYVVLALALKPSTGTAYTLTADKADMTFSGQAAGLYVGREVAADNATMTMAAQDVGLRRTYNNLAADFAALTFAGQDVALSKGQRMTADNATMTMTGQDAGLLNARLIVPDNASMTFAGQDVSLEMGFRVDAEPGTLTLAGQDVAFLFNHLVAAEPGTLTFAGQVVLLTKTWLPLEAGYAELTLSGQDVTLAKGRRVVADYGTLTIAGQTVSFIGPRRFDIGEGYYLRGTAFGYALSGRASGYSLSGRA